MRLTSANDAPHARPGRPGTAVFLAVAAFLLPALLPVVLEGTAAVGRAKTSVESRALDLDGKPANPFAATNATATVLIFVGCECPISNRYAPEIRRLQEKFAARGVRFWIIYPDPDATAAEIRRHVREFNLPGEPLRDPKLWLVRKSQATVTPEAAVFTAAARLAYHGRIDDRVADFGKERPAPAQRDLHDALEAVLAGKKPRSGSTPAVGCRIPDTR
jgi:hypothetical protein